MSAEPNMKKVMGNCEAESVNSEQIKSALTLMSQSTGDEIVSTFCAKTARRGNPYALRAAGIIEELVDVQKIAIDCLGETEEQMHIELLNSYWGKGLSEADIDEFKAEIRWQVGGIIGMSKRINIDSLRSREQRNCSFAAAEILFMACESDCAKAREHFEDWCQSKDAQDPKLEYFVQDFHDAQSAIEDREGQRRIYTVCELSDTIEGSSESSEDCECECECAEEDIS